MSGSLQFITWALIIIGWIVSFLISKHIAKNNHKKTDINAKINTITKQINLIVEHNISYWADGMSLTTAQLILYHLSILEDDVASIEYTQTYSNQLNNLFLNFRKEISLNNEFMTSQELSKDKQNLKIAEISSVAKDMINLVKELKK